MIFFYSVFNKHYLIMFIINDVNDISVPTIEIDIASTAPKADPLERGLLG